MSTFFFFKILTCNFKMHLLGGNPIITISYQNSHYHYWSYWSFLTLLQQKFLNFDFYKSQIGQKIVLNFLHSSTPEGHIRKSSNRIILHNEILFYWKFGYNWTNTFKVITFFVLKNMNSGKSALKEDRHHLFIMEGVYFRAHFIS